MRRGIFDTLRRGFDNAIANWQLALIRFSETLLFGFIAIIGVIVAFVPLIVSLGIKLSDVRDPEDLQGVAMTLLDAWMMFVWVFVGALVLAFLFMLVHSFVEAGCASVFVDADRAAGPETGGARQRFRLFSMRRWLAGAKDGWWAVFWIYNFAWGAGGLVLLIPLIPVAILTYFLREHTGAAVAIGCMGLALCCLFALVVMLTTIMWCNRAIVAWAAQRQGIRVALRTGWRAIKSDLGRHVLIALVMILVSMAVSSALSSFSMMGGFGDYRHNLSFSLVMMPVRMIGQVLGTAFSAMVASWYIASYAALAVENKS